MKLPEILDGSRSKLIPLKQEHINELWETAKEESIWRYYTFQEMKNVMRFKEFVMNSIEMSKNGSEYTFTIVDKSTGQMVGGTSFLDISPENRSLEIGRTWIAPYLQGSGFNTEVKYLLLKYCFEEIHLGRVFFKTDSTNLRSRKALEKIGAVYEGTLRNHMLRQDGSYRHSAYYSIIDPEWEKVKALLENMLAKHNEN